MQVIFNTISKIITHDIAPHINEKCYREQSKRMVKRTSAFRTTARTQAKENEARCKHERSAESLFIHHLVLWSVRSTFFREIRVEVSILVLLITAALTPRM